jgi:hypothetical protein
MARRRGRKSQVRTPAKTMERELVHRAEQLAKDPSKVLPTVVSPCAKDPFAKVLKKMQGVSKFADDEKRLEKLASRGDPIVRAYAGTLMLAAAGKAPYLASLKVPQGEVFYAVRGKVAKEKLVGMQWFDHPIYRLLLFLDMAVKRPYFHFYSTKDKLYCSCKEPRPPADYVEFAMQQPRGNISKVGSGLWACPHVGPEALEAGEPLPGTYLRIAWSSGGQVLGICRRCARSSRSSTLGSIISHMAVPKVEDDFDVRVLHRLKGAEDCPLWDELATLPLGREDLDEYVKGGVDDAELMDRHLEAIDQRLRDHRGAHFILEDRTYCEDASAFVAALSPSDEERLALEAVLPRLDHPLILDRATPAKVLGELWEDHGEEMLGAVVGGDEELMERYLDHPDLDSSPSLVLRRALVDHRKRTIISRLPDYGKLPMVARFADRVARAYRTGGTDEAAKVVEKERGSDKRIKPVAYSFLLALGKETSKMWQYDKTEIDFASFLQDKTKDLLEAEPEDYHGALQALLSATGSTERIPEPAGD